MKIYLQKYFLRPYNTDTELQIATSDPMRSGSVDEKGEEDEDAEDEDKENMYEEAFAKMKRAAGVSEVEEVVHRSVIKVSTVARRLNFVTPLISMLLCCC